MSWSYLRRSTSPSAGFLRVPYPSSGLLLLERSQERGPYVGGCDHRGRHGRGDRCGSCRRRCSTPGGAETGRARPDGFSATGHRQEADALAARAQELGPEAEVLRGKATEAAASAELEVARAKELDARATQAEQRALRAGQGAGRHDAQAAELEEKL